jgi:trimethylamine--corrinoid protein Co-methyltransferase
MCDVLIEYVKRGMPQSLDTMPNAGLTAPVNPAGLLAVGLAETIAGLVLCFAVDPEAVVTLDITPSFADPSTGIYRYAGAERTSLTAARIQLISEYYGCPSGVHGGKTDALAPDIRSGMEKGLTMMMPILSGAVGIGTVGHIENAVTFSPIQLIIDNEIARYVRRAIRGFEISEEAVNFDQIRRIGTEGNYLGDLETAEQFRDFLNLSPFFTVRPWGYSDHTHESGDWLEMARQRVDEILSTEREPVIGADQEREVDEIVHQAEMDLKQKGLL